MSSASGTSSSSERFAEIAKKILSANDRNGSGKLEQDEWSGLRDGGEGNDTNQDGVITVDELAARIAARVSDRGSGSDRGSSDRGGEDRSLGTGPAGLPAAPVDRGPGVSQAPEGRSGETSARGPRDYSSGDVGNYPRSRGSRDNSSPGDPTTRDPTMPKKSYRLTTPTELLPRGLDSWFTQSDANGDGQIAMSEFATKLDDATATKFQQLDANGDGFITANEALRAAAPSNTLRSGR